MLVCFFYFVFSSQENIRLEAEPFNMVMQTPKATTAGSDENVSVQTDRQTESHTQKRQIDKEQIE